MFAPPSSRRFQRSVVRVESAGEQGTAFLIQLNGSSGLFLTALHVVSSASGRSRAGIKLRRGAGRAFSAKLIDANEDRDIALLSASIPGRLHLKPAAVFATRDVGRLAVLRMLDPDRGIVAPLVVSVPFVGETAILYEFGGKEVVIDKVWSQQGLVIPGGTSGAPVMSEDDDAIVAVACAGADPLSQSFFVPLISALPKAGQDTGQLILKAISIAKDRSTRLGRYPNYRGILVRSWLHTKQAVQSLAESGVYESNYVIARPSLTSDILIFLRNDKRNVALLAGNSGTGKSASLAHMVRKERIGRPVIFLRASQIEMSTNPLETALLSALKVNSIADIRHVAFSPETPAPLVILEGLNELPIRRDEWPTFIKDDLSKFAHQISKLGWKLLISTRRERLEELKDFDRAINLYDPWPLGIPSSQPRFISLEGFERADFECLIKLYNLPAGLPFAELRYPLVFRLMVKASKRQDASSVRIRDIFAEYFSGVIQKIHFRCPTRSRERIVEAIEGWTRRDQTIELGLIPSSELGEVSNEAVAESAVAEGLFERVPGGYRYVYDEVFDFVLARGLSERLNSSGELQETSPMLVIDRMLERKYSESAVAKALEIFSDRHPEAHQKFSNQLTKELQDRAPIDESQPGYLLPTQDLYKTIRVLSRVEKGGPIDFAKDELPLFGARGLTVGNTWEPRVGFALAVSDDHISYAFDEDRIWRMIGLAASRREEDDSYPFRRKDLYNERARADAADDIENDERYKVVKHFVTVFPDKAIERLLAALAEDDRKIGREHTFGSFCAQTILAFVDKFDRAYLIAQLASRPGYLSYLLLKQLSSSYPGDFLDGLLEKNTDFLKWPDVTSRVLTNIAATDLSLRSVAAKIALELVRSHGHSVFLYGDFFEFWATTPAKEYIKESVAKSWQAGNGTCHAVATCLRVGMATLNEVIEMYVDRLRAYQYRIGERPGDLISSLEGYFKEIGNVDQVLSSIDHIIERFWHTDIHILKTREQIYATEALLGISTEQGAIRPSLLDLIEEVCRQFPEDALHSLRYPLMRMSEPLLRDVCSVLLPNCAESSVLELLFFASDRMPTEELAKALIKILVEHLGIASVVDRVKWLLDRFGGNPNRAVSRLIKAVVELEPKVSSRYPEIFSSPEKEDDGR